MHNRLLRWFKRYGRHDLPWRKTSDPYKIYLSEIMLQQTQVERVKDYFERFLKRFPTLKSLAEADEEEVLALWSGLGYYVRARNLRKTATFTGGVLPKSYEELIKLPGIGDYTASAICSFAYDQPLPVIDTNIKRVLSRYFATTKGLKKLATSLLHPIHPRQHNLALMDLGALICTPTSAKCQSCPLQPTCQGKGDPLAFSAPKKRGTEKLELFLGLCIQDGKIALLPSTEKLYQGLLVLPHIDPIEEHYIATIRHSYTKYRIQAHLYTCEAPKEAIWIDLEAIDQAPVSNLTKKALRCLHP